MVFNVCRKPLVPVRSVAQAAERLPHEGWADVANMREHSGRLSIMDTLSSNAVARQLGVSRGRVRRAAARLGVGLNVGGFITFTTEDAAALARELGVNRRARGLSASDMRVLAALSNRPAGVFSARELARATGLAPTTVGHALRSLTDKGWVRMSVEDVLYGKAVSKRVMRVNVANPGWAQLLPILAEVRQPMVHSPRPTGVPPSLKYAFWNVEWATFRGLSLERDARFIAYRAITTEYPDLMGFAAERLPHEVWADVAKMRGLSPMARSTALNLSKER
jgi:DNA-binding transcriptional ArsR family regulator